MAGWEAAVVVPEERAVGVRQGMGNRRFLEVVTRTFGGRPEGLARCRNSLVKLESRDWTHMILVDRERRGVERSHRMLAKHEASGQWVWVLDDDDVCAAPGLVDALKRVAAREDHPEVIVVIVQRGSQFLPPSGMWGARPVMGAITSSSVVVRADAWNAHRGDWREVYEGDFWFIDGLWEAGLRWAWLPLIAARIDAPHRGAAEE